MSREAETISVTELRSSTREVIENAHFRGRRYQVQRAGQPMVVILGVQEYMSLLQAANDMRVGITSDAAPKPPSSGAQSGVTQLKELKR